MKPRVAHISEFNRLQGVDFIKWESKATLAPYDIIVFFPTLECIPRDKFRGYGTTWKDRTVISARNFWETSRFWKDEIIECEKHNKLLIVFLDDTEEFAIQTNEHECRFITALDLISDFGLSSSVRVGHSVKLTDSPLNDPISALYDELMDTQKYGFCFSKGQPLLNTGGSSLTVGVKTSIGSSNILVLPKPSENILSEKALSFAYHIFNILSGSPSGEPLPRWLTPYRLSSDLNISRKETLLNEEILASQKSLSNLAADRRKIECFYGLFLGTGKSLENAVKKSLEYIHIQGKPYKKDAIEIDCIFEIGTLLYVIEMEGKDSSPVTVKKFQQLQSRIHELQFEYPDHNFRLTMIGNGYRNTELSQRECSFHEDVIKQAVKYGISLVEGREIFSMINFIDSSTSIDEAKLKSQEWFLSLRAGLNQFKLAGH